MAENRFAEESEIGHLTVDRAAVRLLNARTADIDRSAIQTLKTQSITASNSAFGVARGATVEARESAVGVVTGDFVRVEESTVAVLVAPRVSGNVRAFITLQAAFAFGAGVVLTRLAVSALRHRFAD